jgi:beta-lactam-binding protein with PASTA domain
MKTNIFIFLCIVPFIIFFTTYFIISEYLIRNHYILVEDFCGASLPEFFDWIRKNDLQVKVAKISYDSQLPYDCVLSHYPKAGSKAALQSMIFVHISTNKSFEIPELVGNYIDEAIKKLDSLGFSHRSVEIETKYLDGVVFAQGLEFLGDSKKNVILYKSVRDSKKEYIVGNLIGAKYSKLKEEIEEKEISVVCLNNFNLQIDFEHDMTINKIHPHLGSILKTGDKIYLWHF